MSDALINGLAGAGGGIIAQLITYPLQTVNTRQQTDRDPKKEKKKAGTVEQMYQVIQQEGWGRLYGGLTPSLVGTACSQLVIDDDDDHEQKVNSAQVFAKSKAEATALRRKKEGAGDGSVGMLSSLMVAAMSGCVNVLLTNPIWVVVTRMQTHTKKSPLNQVQPIVSEHAIVGGIEPPPYATSHAVQEVFDEAGIWGFWKGVFPTLVMVSNPSIQFMLYETLLKKLKQRRASSQSNKGVFLLGALAKLGATVVTYPLLVVKSRLQAKQAIGVDKKHQYKGTLDAILKMIRYEGLHGFYKGMNTKIVQSVLAAAVLFMVKEELVNGARWLLLKDAANAVQSKPLR
ncbi:Mitochondrial carrier domain-containing protein [Cynara cardunculus var. scolymus]|uniref:Mitochondrial carrier domain-containing protein n=1 Tax=Cynara cardunculus var. scolymus TaxID=59895 RepID=A0A103YIW9_CYNCS|nr:Mitochondrial carrier domain-containing protein [Cynara cardunculus var. scolymus]